MVTTRPAQRELSGRALLTGLVLGALLTPCNVYAGLKIGWAFNMSITSLLLAFGFWRLTTRVSGGAPWTPLESNINQTATSACASIVSSGLVAPIPALALLTGSNMSLGALVAWVFSVSLLGVWVAWLLRSRLLAQPQLRFPEGMATAETLRELFAQGPQAARRVRALLSAAALAASLKAVDLLWWQLPRWAPGADARFYTFAFDPSPLLLGFGAIVGLRTGLALLGGALLAWGGLAPLAVNQGWVAMPASATESFGVLVQWLLWPGVALMVSSTLVSFLLGWRRLARHRTVRAARKEGSETAPASRWLWPAIAGSVLLTVVLQHWLFGISWWLALLAVPLALALAVVAARVVGETGVPPIGAIGQMSQMTLGAMAPGQLTANLMAANVAGGAAGQCTDLMNDLKVGREIGAAPRRQLLAQLAGILTGSLVGSWLYLRLIPDPRAQLLTAEWPAPAVATWKAVAETVGRGLDAVPPSAQLAMIVAGIAGALLGMLEAQRVQWRWLPSGAAIGLAFVIPASTSITLATGALLGALWQQLQPQQAQRFSLAIAAGLITGESLFGVAHALLSLS